MTYTYYICILFTTVFVGTFKHLDFLQPTPIFTQLPEKNGFHFGFIFHLQRHAHLYSNLAQLIHMVAHSLFSPHMVKS